MRTPRSDTPARAAHRSPGRTAPGPAATAPVQRVAPIRGLVDVLAGLGVEPTALLAEFGLRPSFFDEPENTLPIATFDALLGRCAQAARCPHLGLLVGALAGASTLGVVGYLMMSSPDLRSALGVLQRDLPVNNGYMTVTLDVHGDTASLALSLLGPGLVHGDQILDCAVAIGTGILRSVCGPAWRPTGVELAHAAPRDVAPYRRLFGRAPQFDAERSALHFASRWLDHALPGADAMLHRYMAGRLRELRARAPDSSAARVRRLLRTMVANGDCTMPTACERLGIAPHTLRRRLAAEGTSFRALRDEVRHEVARQLLRHTSTPVGEVALILGFSEPGALTRAFRRREGAPPRAWREGSGRGGR